MQLTALLTPQNIQGILHEEIKYKQETYGSTSLQTYLDLTEMAKGPGLRVSALSTSESKSVGQQSRSKASAWMQRRAGFLGTMYSCVVLHHHWPERSSHVTYRAGVSSVLSNSQFITRGNWRNPQVNPSKGSSKRKSVKYICLAIRFAFVFTAHLPESYAYVLKSLCNKQFQTIGQQSLPKPMLMNL